MSNRIASLAVLVLLASGAWASEGEVKPVACPQDLALSRSQFFASESQFFKPTEPKGTVNPHVVVAMLRNGSVTLAVAVDSAKPDAKRPDLVRFDFSGKGDFAGAPTLPLQAQSDQGQDFFSSIGPATLEIKRDGKVLPVSVQGNYQKRPDQRFLSLQVGTALEGRLAFGAKTYAVRVVDGNGDLAFGARATTFRNGRTVQGIGQGDTLAIDTGDGSFASGRKVIKAYYGHPVRVHGVWYGVALSADGTKITATPWAGETSTLKLAHESWSLKLAGEKHIVLLDGSTEPVAIPADRYTVAEFVQTVPSGQPENGYAWKARLTSGQQDMWRGKGKTFEAAAGKTVELAIGAPLAGSVAANIRGSSVVMDFKLADAAGLQAQVSLATQGQLKVEVEVLDAAGKQVHQGQFSYG